MVCETKQYTISRNLLLNPSRHLESFFFWKLLETNLQRRQEIKRTNKADQKISECLQCWQPPSPDFLCFWVSLIRRGSDNSGEVCNRNRRIKTEGIGKEVEGFLIFVLSFISGTVAKTYSKAKSFPAGFPSYFGFLCILTPFSLCFFCLIRSFFFSLLFFVLHSLFHAVFGWSLLSSLLSFIFLSLLHLLEPGTWFYSSTYETKHTAEHSSTLSFFSLLICVCF